MLGEGGYTNPATGNVETRPQAVDASGDTLTVDGSLTPMGYQQITGITDTTAVALTVPAGARLAEIIPENQPMRSRDDGTAPTATVGMPRPVNQVFFYRGDLAAIRFVNSAATTANGILNITYFG